MAKSIVQEELEKIIGDFTQKELLQKIRPIFRKRFPEQNVPSQPSISRYLSGENPIRREVLDCIFEAYSIGSHDRSRLLTAAGYTTEPSEEIKSPALQKLILALGDATLSNDVKENIQRDVEAVIDGWRTYTQIEAFNHQRKWSEASNLYATTRQLITTALSRLPQYLKLINARTLSHLFPEKNILQLLENDLNPALFDEDLYFAALVYATRGSLFRNQGQLDHAIANFNDAIKRLRQLDRSERIHKIERKRAIPYLLKGDWNRAEVSLKRCLLFFEEQENVYELARIHYDLGWVYNLSGDWDQANYHNKKGLELAQSVLRDEKNSQLDDDLKRSAFKFLELLGLSFQANDARQKGQLNEALLFYEQAEAILNKLPDKREEGWVFLGKARVYAQLAQRYQTENARSGAITSLQFARDYFERAIESGESAKYYYRLAMAQTHYARFFLNQGDVGAATEIIEEAITNAKQANAIYYLNQAKVVACEVYRFQKQFARVGRLIREIQKDYEEHHFNRLMARVKVIEAGMALEQKSVDKAALLFAQSLHYSLTYNRPTVEEIQKNITEEVSQAGKKGVLQKDAFRPLYDHIADHLAIELNEQPFSFDSKKSSLASEVILTLRKQAKIA
jgi:tetratricopeptide (TPR) repeat protein